MYVLLPVLAGILLIKTFFLVKSRLNLWSWKISFRHTFTFSWNLLCLVTVLAKYIDSWFYSCRIVTVIWDYISSFVQNCCVVKWRKCFLFIEVMSFSTLTCSDTCLYPHYTPLYPQYWWSFIRRRQCLVSIVIPTKLPQKPYRDSCLKTWWNSILSPTWIIYGVLFEEISK